MSDVLDVGWAMAWVREAARVMAEHREELIELDRQIGDGDHGENMHRGFSAVLARLDALETEPAQVSDVLRLVATTLMSTVGGAAGPLYGTAYLRAAGAAGTGGPAADSAGRADAAGTGRLDPGTTADPDAAGPGELDAGGVVAVLAAGLEGVVARGKATTGEKTMVDAWAPAVEAAAAAARAGAGADRVLAVAAEAAEAGAVATVPMLATKGRASYLGERSIGHQDPGATSTALILRAAATAAGA